MTLNIKIGEDELLEPQLTIKLKARKTLDGNIIISDHAEIDIIISPKNKTIITFPKEKVSSISYDVQNRLFKTLQTKGVIELGSVQGGNVFGSLQATYPENDDVSSLQMVLLVISRFLEEEKDKFAIYDEFDDEFEQRYTDPEEDDSTELGEVPHSRQKGAIRPGYIYSPYGISSIYRYE
tara:strand:- start:61 stop:600 length:540 start_codon:yes stop_codon:yes gene_type:complete